MQHARREPKGKGIPGKGRACVDRRQECTES